MVRAMRTKKGGGSEEGDTIKRIENAREKEHGFRHFYLCKKF